MSIKCSKTEIFWGELRIVHLTQPYTENLRIKNTILWVDSFHPPSLINNTPFGQFQTSRDI